MGESFAEHTVIRYDPAGIGLIVRSAQHFTIHVLKAMAASDLVVGKHLKD